MLVHPLPYAGADRLVMLRPANPSHNADSGAWIGVAPANMLDWQVMAKSFDAVAGYQWQSVDLTGGDRSERLRGLRITPGFFKVLDVQLMGDTFNPSEAQQRKSEIILGRGLWRRRFGSDATLLHKFLDVNVINLSRVGPTPYFVAGIER